MLLNITARERFLAANPDISSYPVRAPNGPNLDLLPAFASQIGKCAPDKNGNQTYPRPGKGAAIPAALSLLLMLTCSFGCGSDTRAISHLRAADVPLLALPVPADPTVVFPELFPLQIAVYWSSADENPLSMVHALRQAGIPFFVTHDLIQALRHHLVIIYPSVDGETFTNQQTNALTRYVKAGGHLFATNVFASALKPLFGFRNYVPSRRRYRVDFTNGADPALRYFNRPEEEQVPLGSAKYGDIFWSNGYVQDEAAAVLARFDDGTIAVLRKTTGKGNAYLCGLSFHDVVLRNQVNRDYDAERHYVNVFEPGADVWILLLRAWYESQQPNAVRLATIPGGQNSALLLSHDVDWANSFAPALDFARMEVAHHTSSTFFIQAKYVNDYNSHSFFFGQDLSDLKQLHAFRFSVGSHSIIHSRGFNKFTLGTGLESFPAYQPRATGFDTATGATVFGEVRVSKQLLDGELPSQQTIFFRAGHLRVPPTLPEALARSGYLFDSSFTAADVLTNFPYPLPLDLGFDRDSGLFEFPVTIEDEESSDLPGRPAGLPGRIDKALDVIQANAENGAISVLLIHPSDAQAKLAAEEAILKQLPTNIMATDMLSFARFWRARDRLRWTVVPSHDPTDIQLTAATDEPVDGLTFEFQRDIAEVEGRAQLSSDRRRLVLPSLGANERISLRIRYSPEPHKTM
jgi:hypothetical protein